MARQLVPLWVLVYALAWTFITYHLDPTVPYDAVEALNWAHNAEWGSPKNPWLVGLFMRPALWLSPNAWWYASHFFAIALGMAGSWVFARLLSGSDSLAWLALLTLNLSGLINFDIISYNDNFLLVMLWPWMMVFYLLAITHSPRWWPVFSLIAGLATMAKYSTLVLVSFIFLSTLLVPRLHRCYRHPAWYLALGLNVALLAPNAVWLWQHNFAALQWVTSQLHTGINAGLFDTLLCVYYPLLILAGILRGYKARLSWPAEWQKQLMLVVYLLPLGIICLWFLFFSSGRLTEWLQPFFILAPPLLVSCASPVPQKLSRPTLAGLFAPALLVLLGYTGVMYGNIANAGQKMRGVIPFSNEVNQRWLAQYSVPLRYVGGEYLAEWLTFYVPSRPQTITPWSAARPNIYNPHISLAQIRRYGAVLVGEEGIPCTQATFPLIKQQWPELSVANRQQITFRESPGSQEKAVCIAFIRPE